MILCDNDLADLIENHGLIADPDMSLINPASIDIRIGKRMLLEDRLTGRFMEHQLSSRPENATIVPAGSFALVDTLEHFHVPNGYAMDLRLKSSIARQGWNHSLAFWVDPGWRGVLTMEIQNIRQGADLLLCSGVRFAQVIVHKLSGLSSRLYDGKYNNATGVEQAKEY